MRAVVTGTASGIGRAVAARLIADGASVYGLDVRSGDEALLRHDGKYKHQRGDVGDSETWRLAEAGAKEALGGVDALINVAGISFVAPVAETSLTDWSRIMSVNLTGTFLGVQSMLSELVASRGSIVNVSSVLGIAGRPGYAAYSASKGGIIGLTAALAAELGPSGVRVNCVCPGPIATGMAPYNPDVPESLLGMARIPLDRQGEAHEVASAICYLAGGDASYVSGVVMPVDGGRLAI